MIGASEIKEGLRGAAHLLFSAFEMHVADHNLLLPPSAIFVRGTGFPQEKERSSSRNPRYLDLAHDRVVDRARMDTSFGGYKQTRIT